MKYKILLLSILLLNSCQKSKEDKEKELLECLEKHDSKWVAAMSRPVNHPILNPVVTYYFNGKVITSTETLTDIANEGWGFPSQGRSVGDGSKFPDSVSVSYEGLTNKLEMYHFEGGAKLPLDKIRLLFKEGYIERGKKQKFKYITTGMAPGGRVCVWVDFIEIFRFKVNQKELSSSTPIVYFGDESEVLNYLKKHPLEYKVWDSPEERYILDFGFCSESKKVQYTNGYFYTKNGQTIPVYYNNIDETVWGVPFGEKVSISGSYGYQQFNERKVRDKKINLPIDGVINWLDGKNLYSTEINFPENFPKRFLTPYINPMTKSQSNYNRLVIGVEKDGEHCIIWLDGPGKQEKLMRFKGIRAIIEKNKMSNDTIEKIGGYPEEVIYYN